MKKWLGLLFILFLQLAKVSAFELFEPYEAITRLYEHGYRLEKSNFPTRYNVHGFAIMVYPSGHLSIENASLWHSKSGSWHNVFTEDPNWRGVSFAAGHEPLMTISPISDVMIYPQGLGFTMNGFDYHFQLRDGHLFEVTSNQELGPLQEHYQVNSKNKKRRPNYSGPDLPEQVFRLMGLTLDDHFLLYNVEGITLNDLDHDYLYIRTNQHIFYQLHLPSGRLQWLSKAQAAELGLRWPVLQPGSVWLP